MNNEEKFSKYRSPGRKQFVESFLELLEIHAFLIRDFFEFNIEGEFK